MKKHLSQHDARRLRGDEHEVQVDAITGALIGGVVHENAAAEKKPSSSYFFSNSFTYSPYPSAASLRTGMKRIDAEFMQ